MFPVEEYMVLVEKCNSWNRDRHWPMAFVSKAKSDSLEVQIKTVYTLFTSPDVSVATLEAFVVAINSATTSFWTSLGRVDRARTHV
jgi:hypothetical protein